MPFIYPNIYIYIYIVIPDGVETIQGRQMKKTGEVFERDGHPYFRASKAARDMQLSATRNYGMPPVEWPCALVEVTVPAYATSSVELQEARAVVSVAGRLHRRRYSSGYNRRRIRTGNAHICHNRQRTRRFTRIEHARVFAARPHVHAKDKGRAGRACFCGGV